jgi:hypothetical protein
MTAQPDPVTARNAAFLLSAMSEANACDLRKIMDGIRAGMVLQFGWQQADADAFALAFGDAVVDAVRAMPKDGAVH